MPSSTITASAASEAVTDVTSGSRAPGWLRAFHTDAGVRWASRVISGPSRAIQTISAPTRAAPVLTLTPAPRIAIEAGGLINCWW